MAALISPSVARNKGPILDVLKSKIEFYRSKNNNLLSTGGSTDVSTEGQAIITPINVLEVASGTGEHAAYFTSCIPGLLYQPTEPDQSMHNSIIEWSKPILSNTTEVGDPSTTDGSTISTTSKVFSPLALDVISFLTPSK